MLGLGSPARLEHEFPLLSISELRQLQAHPAPNRRLRTPVLDNFMCLGLMAQELLGALGMSALLLENVQLGWEDAVLGWVMAPCVMHG